MATPDTEVRSTAYGNVLYTDSTTLDAEMPDALERLRTVLSASRLAIVSAIDQMYAVQSARNSSVQRGSVWLMRLATSKEQVIFPSGVERDAVSQENRGVFCDISEIQEDFRDFWQAVLDVELLPEGRVAHGINQFTGFWLLARDTPLV